MKTVFVVRPHRPGAFTNTARTLQLKRSMVQKSQFKDLDHALLFTSSVWDYSLITFNVFVFCRMGHMARGPGVGPYSTPLGRNFKAIENCLRLSF